MMTLFKTGSAPAFPDPRVGARRVSRGWSWVLAVALLGGCALPDKPKRSAMYDFGPGALSASAPAAPLRGGAALAPLAIADIATSGGALDNQAVLYRLGYTDAQQLRPYSQARWSMPPALLLRQRLRERLGQDRAVFNAREGVALNRSQHVSLPLLRLELEEFSQLFSTPADSVGLVRLHATLLEITPAGERLVAQRSVVVQRPAPSADAPGGVQALTAASDAAIDEIDQWLRQAPTK
ncbi:MAG: ABC-type transport auxiliary lipoprotein family protein [Pseudomonadota bacterium]|nr:ABC-type transport auxiliary lipoprotein family protein [Pseudomonadota bacterium]